MTRRLAFAQDRFFHQALAFAAPRCPRAAAYNAAMALSQAGMTGSRGRSSEGITWISMYILFGLIAIESG